MIFKFSFAAKNWEEYISQGEEFEKLKDWWLQNWKSVGGKDDSYSAWKFWYKNAYNEYWDSQHKSPTEAMEFMKKLQNQGLNDFLAARKENRDKRSETLSSIFSDSDAMGKSMGTIDGTLVDISTKKPNLNGLNKNLYNIANAIGSAAKALGLPKPVITSAKRDYRQQAKAMAKNWKKYGGGGEASLTYLLNLYGDDDMARGIHEIFTTYGIGADGVAKAENYFETQKPNASPHLSGRGLDFRLTSGIEKAINEVVSSGKFNFKVVKEADHYHIQVPR